jgi:hypothetical protein
MVKVLERGRYCESVTVGLKWRVQDGRWVLNSQIL